MSTDFGDIDDVIGGIPAIKVHLVKSDLQEKRPREYRVTHKTVVLTATSPTYQLMGVDPARFVLSRDTGASVRRAVPIHADV